MNSSIANMITSLAIVSPILVIAVTALVIAIVNWKRAPTASLLCLIAFGGILLKSIVWPVLYAWVPTMLDSEPEAIGMVFRVLSFVHALLLAGMYILLIMAIYAGRPKATSFSQEKLPPKRFE